MAIVYLSGGTGNHLFQFTRAQPEDRFSYAFISPVMNKVLGWTQHERLFDFPKASVLAQVFGLLVLAFDLPLAKLTGRSLFSKLDLRALKAEPLITRLVQFGYFQKLPATRDVQELSEQIDSWKIKEGAGHQCAIHIRGGDVLALQASGRNSYGVLAPDYFEQSIVSLGRPAKVTIYTNDRDYAEAMIEQIGLSEVQFTIDTGSLDEMIAGCCAADGFVACNSTLSYWVLQLRGAERPSVAPDPFTKDLDIDLPPYVEGIPVVY